MIKLRLPNSKGYKKFLGEISTILEKARKKAIKQVNILLVDTCWQIGKRIWEYAIFPKNKFDEYRSELSLDELIRTCNKEQI